MANITERGGRFFVRVRRDGKSVGKTFSKKGDAAAWARRTESDIESGRFVDVAAVAAAATAAQEATTATATPTMGEALTTYRAAVVAGLKGATTYGYWLDEFGQATMAAKLVNEVTPFDLAAWRDQQSKKLSAGTVVRKLGLLSGFFTWCHKERGWIKANPLHSVRKPRVNDARDRTLTDEERRYLLAAAGSSRAGWLADVLVVLLQSAMRRGELWGLQRADVDFDQSTAHLADTKNGSARDVPLCGQALAALRRLDAAAAARGGTALVPLSDPHAVSVAFRRTLGRAQRQYVKDCGGAGVVADAGFLVGVRVHDLRHCSISEWANTGALSMIELMSLSGHKSPRMLARYAHMNVSKLAGKMATISTQQQKAA